MKETNEFKHIVRIANTDLDGNKPIIDALRKIKGVSFMFANGICAATGIDKEKKTGYLLDSEIEKIDNAIRNPSQFNIPSWLYNRRKDYESGADLHLTGGNLKLFQENDIRRQKKIKSYVGMRHAYGLPVRGQRTKSNFRKNKGKALGVKRKKSKSGRV